MRVFAAALGTESNSFGPVPTGWATFREALFEPADASLRSDNYFVQPLKAWRAAAAARGDDYVEGLATFAQPGGPTVQAVWEELRDQLLDQLRAALPVDAVLLNLHGAMVATGCDDCEGELVSRVRALVGPSTTIGVELDLHCHLTARLQAEADAIVLYKEYPHTDLAERAVELYAICADAAAGRTRPKIACYDCRMLGVWRTTDAPVRRIVERMQAMEREPGVLSVSLGHGFPWGDVAEVGAKALAVTDGDLQQARSLAAEIGAMLWAIRDSYATPMLSVAETVAALRDGSPGLTVVADVSDNAGGGAASDSTWILAALLEAGVGGIALGAFWDPVAVRLCAEAGEGSRLALRIGGKVGPMSGPPVDLEVTVRRVVENASQPFGDGRQPMGTAVLVEGDGLQLLLNGVRTQVFHPDAFTQAGVDFAALRGAVVKSAQHFHAGFAPLASRVLYAAAPGTMSPDMVALPLTRAARPLWPKVGDPYA